jgi:hypothetical protein
MADALGAITVSGNPAVEAVLSGSTGAIETAVAQAATATVASAATRAAAAYSLSG